MSIRIDTTRPDRRPGKAVSQKATSWQRFLIWLLALSVGIHGYQTVRVDLE